MSTSSATVDSAPSSAPKLPQPLLEERTRAPERAVHRGHEIKRARHKDRSRVNPLVGEEVVVDNSIYLVCSIRHIQDVWRTRRIYTWPRVFVRAVRKTVRH